MSLSSPAALTAPAAASPAVRSRASLVVAMLGFAVVTLDTQVVNVALPDISRDLAGSLAGLQWVVTGYTLMFSALLLFAGTCSDRIGARRAYGVGMLVFVTASVVCGLAPSLGWLIAARVVQGVGAALVTPTSLALIRAAYHDSAARARAIAYWAMGGSIAAAAGPVLGGALTQLDWRLIFFLNLPVGVVAVLVLRGAADSPRHDAPFDWTGQVAAVVALAGLTYAVIEGGNLGYGNRRILAAFAVAVVAAVVFLAAQARGRHPMVPLDLFRSRTVSVALIVSFLGMVGFYGVVFLQSLYFQQLRGASPFVTGLLFLPMTALVAILNPLAARTAVRLGPAAPIIGGQLVMAAGLAGLVLLPADAPVLLVAAAMVPVGVGGSFTVPPITALILDSVPHHRAGTASGVFNTFRQLGGSFGVAVYGAVVASQATFLHGLHLSLTATAVLLLLTATASLALRGPRH
ncbi:MFS transporter [Micromonospora globispora]|uniref:MFS transporter n=1 Tax=Micromonospora globispora TaxID=1450148 RepID=A0A317K2V2_9ACTN|nr:MFS transporter [Micromonospora globispora]PWU47367.1 MFS transporter [Micromonospora globispora]PWU61376.1 MFS transporter [Micromonospora globispora]RQX00561.1 MFS transporter [Micromonospora globispora]